MTTFSRQSTTDQVLEGVDLTGKLALITGGASGIGQETARALASKGASIVIAARDMQRAEEVRKEITASTGNSSIDLLELELASLAKVKASAEDFLSRFKSLNLLINNAGIMACPEGKTEDGFELQFGSNHIGHFYFTNLIMPAILKGAPARVINLSSLAHRISPVLFDDIHFAERRYEKWSSYGQSKTANALFSLELDARLKDKDVRSYSVHPGVIMTNLGRHMTDEDRKMFDPENNDGQEIFFKSVEQGAATTCWAATAKELEEHGGAYLEDCQVAEKLQMAADDRRGGVRPYAYDTKAAQELWAVSEDMVGQKFDF